MGSWSRARSATSPTGSGRRSCASRPSSSTSSTTRSCSSISRDIITYWNKGAEQLYGWSREEALGRVVHDLLKTDFPRPLQEIVTGFLQDGRWEGELVHTTRDGAVITVLSRWALLRDSAGAPIGSLEINSDISERKLQEEDLRKLNVQLTASNEE